MSAPVKTEQVRIPLDLMRDVRATAPVLGESASDYVARVLRDAVRRDMPRAARELTKRAQRPELADTAGLGKD